MRDLAVTVIIDVPKWGFVKRDDDGAVDFVSPLPSPFNYGHVPGTLAEDGDAFDAVVLGKRLARETSVTVAVQARMGFLDAGAADPKLICAPEPLAEAQRRQVERFFRRYAVAKRLINGVRGKRGPTRYLGWL
jgi:inorganic pyrophosphatase